jgi:hypothetical protein
MPVALQACAPWGIVEPFRHRGNSPVGGNELAVRGGTGIVVPRDPNAAAVPTITISITRPIQGTALRTKRGIQQLH